MRPRVQRHGQRREQRVVRRAGVHREAHGPVRRERQRVGLVARRLLLTPQPRAGRRRRIEPRLERESPGQIQRLALRDLDRVVHPIEAQPVAEPARRPRGSLHQRARVPVARPVRRRRPRAFAERPRRAGHDGRGRRPERPGHIGRQGGRARVRHPAAATDNAGGVVGEGRQRAGRRERRRVCGRAVADAPGHERAAAVAQLDRGRRHRRRIGRAAKRRRHRRGQDAQRPVHRRLQRHLEGRRGVHGRRPVERHLGGAEHPPVNPHFVEQAGQPVAEPHRLRGRYQRAGHRPAGDRCPIEIDLQVRPVERHGQVRPRIQRQLHDGEQRVVGRAGVHPKVHPSRPAAGRARTPADRTSAIDATAMRRRAPLA